MSSGSSKRVAYRGGIASFDLPASWVEEYEAAGGGTFYEDRPDSGTLRLNVLGFDSESTPAQEMAVSALKGAVERSAEGFPLHYEIRSAEEAGEQLEIHRWQVAIPVLPHTMRLAVFSYTILAGQQRDPRIAEELRVVDTAVRNASFSTQRGVSGNYDHSADA
jgi:hypothetical protein